MPVSPAREVAYRVLRRVESGRSFAVDLLQGSALSRLKEVDRKLATELVMGVLRWSGELVFQVERLSGKALKYFDPEISTILRLGIYQVRFLQKIPKSAVVNEAVEMAKAARKRSAAGLVNAVLWKCEPPVRFPSAKQSREPDPESLVMARRSLPAWLFERWTQNFGAEAVQSLAWRSTVSPPTTLRIIRPNLDLEEIQHQLAEQGVLTRSGRFGRRALVVESGSVHAVKAVQEGQVVIQDEASQLVAEILLPEPGNAVLDLCAAPGIKTGQIAAALDSGLIVACDLSARRLRTMLRLLPKSLPESVRLDVVRLDATRDLPFDFKFDRILLDVPCSGTGTLARNPEIKFRLQPRDLVRLAETQAGMLRNALTVLAPGGRLVYATCSLEPEENEQVVEEVLNEKRDFRSLTHDELSQEFPALSDLFDARGHFRTRPDFHFMDGFFAAVIVHPV